MVCLTGPSWPGIPDFLSRERWLSDLSAQVILPKVRTDSRDRNLLSTSSGSPLSAPRKSPEYVQDPGRPRNQTQRGLGSREIDTRHVCGGAGSGHLDGCLPSSDSCRVAVVSFPAGTSVCLSSSSDVCTDGPCRPPGASTQDEPSGPDAPRPPRTPLPSAPARHCVPHAPPLARLLPSPPHSLLSRCWLVALLCGEVSGTSRPRRLPCGCPPRPLRWRWDSSLRRGGSFLWLRADPCGCAGRPRRTPAVTVSHSSYPL